MVGRAALLAALLPVVPGLALGESAAPPAQVFVLAGQSNMMGRGKPLSLASPTSPHLLLWRDGRWQIASDPLGALDNPKSGIGPGMTFGLQLVKREPRVRIGLIMCARGATSIREWQHTEPAYRKCVDGIRASGAHVTALLFLQGENDAQTAAAAATWGRQFKRMLAAFRTDLHAQVPCLLGQIGQLDERFPAQQRVRDEQARVAATTPGVRLVRTADLPTDGLHFTVPAYRVVGARFATAWWRMAHARPPTR